MGGNDLLTYTSSLNEILSWMIHWFDGEEEAHRTGIKQKAVSGSTGSDNTRQIFVLLCLLRGFQTVYYFMERKVALHGAVVKANSALGLFFNHKGRFLFCRYLVVNQSFGGIPHFDLRKRWKVRVFVADCRCQIPRPSIWAISIRTLSTWSSENIRNPIRHSVIHLQGNVDVWTNVREILPIRWESDGRLEWKQLSRRMESVAISCRRHEHAFVWSLISGFVLISSGLFDWLCANKKNTF